MINMVGYLYFCSLDHLHKIMISRVNLCLRFNSFCLFSISWFQHYETEYCHFIGTESPESIWSYDTLLIKEKPLLIKAEQFHKRLMGYLYCICTVCLLRVNHSPRQTQKYNNYNLQCKKQPRRFISAAGLWHWKIDLGLKRDDKSIWGLEDSHVCSGCV